jgi:hypothetical protein
MRATTKCDPTYCAASEYTDRCHERSATNLAITILLTS